MVDIRIPIGLMFSIVGVLISVFGFFTMSNTGMYQKVTWHQCKHYNGIIDACFWIDNALFCTEERRKHNIRNF